MMIKNSILALALLALPLTVAAKGNAARRTGKIDSLPGLSRRGRKKR